MAKEKEVPVYKNPWVIGIVVLIAVVLIAPSISLSGPSELDSFAQCITDAGAVKYGTDWCPFCASQKELFGSSFKYVNYVNCDKDQEACLRARVTGYPTWVVNGQSYSGVQPLESLASYTGCQLP